MSAEPAKRNKLDRERIVDTVLQLADTAPHKQITFKRLGDALNVDATAMYRHFRNKNDLICAALDRLSAQATETAKNTKGNWRAKLEALFTTMAQHALKYPAIVSHGTVVTPIGPGDTAAVELMLELLQEAGVPKHKLVHAYTAVSGFALTQSAALASDILHNNGAPRDGSVPWIPTFQGVQLQDFPLVMENSAELLKITGMDIFTTGMRALLDAVSNYAEH